MRTYILLAISVLAGLLAFAIFWNKVEAEKSRLGLQGRKVKVLVARQEMVKGETITNPDTQLDLREVFQSSLNPTADGNYTQVELNHENLRQIINKRLAVPLAKGEPLRWTDFEDSTRRRRDAFAYLVDAEHNLRALSLSVDNTRSVSGLIQPNDHVDIIGTFRFPQNRAQSDLESITLTLLQNITVLAAGQRYHQGQISNAPREKTYSTVTLAVTVKEAELLVFAQGKGELTLTLRNPEDPYIEKDTQDVDFKYLKDHIKVYTQERKKTLDLESKYRQPAGAPAPAAP